MLGAQVFLYGVYSVAVRNKVTGPYLAPITIVKGLLTIFMASITLIAASLLRFKDHHCPFFHS